MATFRPKCLLSGVDSPVYERRLKRQEIGFPVKEIKVTNETLCVNSEKYRDSIPSYDPDDLEKQLASGQNLDVVSSKILSPDSLDDITSSQIEAEFAKKDDNNSTND